MTPEEKAAIAKAEQEKANAEPIEEEESTESEEGAAEDASASQIDFAAELAKERERREKAEKELSERAFKERNSKRKKVETEDSDDGGDDVDNDKPLTKRELSSYLREQEERTEKRLQEQTALAMAKRLSSSDAEASLIVENWKNYKMPGDTIEEQIEFAHAGINRKRLLAQTAEAKRALASRDNRSKNAAPTHRDPQPGGEVKMRPQDAAAIKAAGMQWNGSTRRYEKKVGKKVLCFDPKTGKRWFS